MIKVNLREILEDKKMTLTELSKETGITMKTLSAFQNQKVESVQFNTLEKITYALDITVEDLITKVVDIFNISIKFEEIFNERSESGYFIITWWHNEEFYQNTPVQFKVVRENRENYKRVEFILDKFDDTLPGSLFTMPKIAYDYFERNNLFYNNNSFLELISYLLVQEYITEIADESTIYDQYILNVSNIVPVFTTRDISKDEARFTDVGNIFLNNKMLYYVNLTSKDSALHLKRNNITATDKVTANIESLSNTKFINFISINDDFKRDVSLIFD
ncbi:helix-turn-helix domain-containing protein [Phocicoccus pinnipedialis]|uniref:HTH cro/C1-type domain-containing protein n=1 Tax=Phocicoccus pinnipedialis TaxID=110845 RepID=A0A6V7R562_9BACL|nr:helix-turn-helix transcriptional regulator [Jeotgalicoccus pinnipedialis]MBP1939847.1 DNA-binding Xre family transcriptional regulator [Jeotgalicoccus pinnipedialis]CAD2072569.1 hypothetical protein JEOPIN946_00568 [Jeotgalicoccus pinnipedialis]